MIAQSLEPYGAILLLIVVATGIGLAILLLTHLIGTYRKGEVKDSVYESGMPPVGDARRRFNIRFYVVAILFLIFDVEVVLLWPWTLVFHKAAVQGQAIGDPAVGKGFLLVVMGIFVGLLVVGYAYEWRKGVFKWD